jgi:hypothetical protein
MIEKLPRWAADVLLGFLVLLVGFLLNRELNHIDTSLKELSAQQQTTQVEIARMKGFLQAQQSNAHENYQAAAQTSNAALFP